MHSRLRIVVFALLLSQVDGCTKRNPEYCDRAEDCPGSQTCDLDLNRCVEHPDAATVPSADADTADATTTDAPVSVAFAKQFGDTGYDSADAVAIDGSGDVFVVGVFQGTVDFGDGEVTSAGGNRSMFVAKYAGLDGKHVWSKFYQATEQLFVNDLSVDADGTLAICGAFKGTLNLGGGNLVAPDTTTDGFVGVFSAAGEHVWSREFGNGTAVNAVGLRAGTAYLTGGFTGAVDFGDGEVVGNSSVFLVSYRASDGAHQWSNTYTSSEASGNYAYDLAVDTAGDVAVTGQFWGDINFGGGLANGADVGQWPLAGAIEPSIAASANGNLIAAGRFDPSLDVDSTNFTTAGGFDGFLVQSDPR